MLHTVGLFRMSVDRANIRAIYHVLYCFKVNYILPFFYIYITNHKINIIQH